MRARRGGGNNKAKAMPPMTEKDGVPADYHGSWKEELDGRGQVPELSDGRWQMTELGGRGQVPELPPQGLTHEMI